MNCLWVRMPVDLIGKINASSLILLSLLMNRDLGTHEITFSREEIAADMQCTVRNLDKRLNELESAGLILSRKKLPYAVRITLKADILPPRKSAGNRRTAEAPTPNPRNKHINYAAESIDPADLDLLMLP